MINSDQLGDPMKKRRRPSFSPEYRLEASQLVVDQNYTVILAAKAMNEAFPLWLNG
jgi:transposase-like protein